ncbi:MAG: ParB/RepB/Spo0J family partition protein [Candidatus Omnitrophica bacterium]|nr:ParB/RepB/Spo0J family partition protein [Candidatus Omnitrophota bacterium]
MERRALGKGISALIPEKENDSRESIVFLKVDQVKANPYQPREDFDTQSLEELMQSIKEKGVIQPILVRRKGDYYELIAGERRLRAVTALNLGEVPAIVKNVEDQDSLELSLIENIQRQELNPIEEAKAYQYLIDKFNLTQERVSEILGKARVTVTNTLRLLRLPQEIQEDVRRNRISLGHGKALLEIEDNHLQRRLVNEVVTRGLSVRELENLIKNQRRGGEKKRALKTNSDPLIGTIEAELQQILATKVRISKKSKRGNIQIEFYSPSDLERILNKIRGGITT